MRYFIKKDNNQLGPFTIDELKELLDAGNIELTDLASPEGSSHFLPLSLLNLFPSPVTTPPEDNQSSESSLEKSENASRILTQNPDPMLLVQFYLNKKEKTKKNLLDVFLDALGTIIENRNWLFFIIFQFGLAIFLFMKYLSVYETNNKLPPSNQDLIQLVGLGIFLIYIYISSWVMGILAAHKLNQGYESKIIELFDSAQRKILKFLMALVLFGLGGFLLIYLPLSLLPVEIRSFTMFLGISIFFYFTLRLLFLPVIVVLEGKGFIESIKFSLLITKGNLGRLLITIFVSILILPFSFLLFAFGGRNIRRIGRGVGNSLIPFLFFILNLIFPFVTHLYLYFVERAEEAGIIPKTQHIYDNE